MLRYAETNSIRVIKITAGQIMELCGELERMRIGYNATIVHGFDPNALEEHTYRNSISMSRLNDEQTMTLRDLLKARGLEFQLSLNSVENKQIETD